MKSKLIVHFSNGNSLVTSINGTKQEIKDYYLGKTFNVGATEDVMAKVIKIEFL